MPRPDPERYARDPWAELTDDERARAKRTLLHRLLAGGAAFLAVVVLGLVPAALSGTWPSLGRAATLAVLVLAPAIAVGLLVFALLRLRR